MRAKLTDTFVRKADLPPTGYTLVWDQETVGFGLRITAAGSKAFIVAYTTKLGRERRLTLGQYPALSVLAARRLAIETRGRVYAGGDPLQEQREIRRPRQLPHQGEALGELKNRYFIEHVAVRRTAQGRKNEETYWRHILARLTPDLKVSEITKGIVQKLHADLSDKPIRANRVITSLSTALNCAVEWGWIANNPARRVSRNPENPRERYLSDAEIDRLNSAIDAHPVRDSALAVRFLLLTGARRGETLVARWSDIDLERAVWVKPAATTKARRVHRVALSNPAISLLLEMRSRHPGSEFVFPGAHDNPLTSFKRSWSSIRAKAGLSGFRLHDLRHSHASLIARTGAGLLVIGRALGHTQPSTTMRYAHLTDETLREAADKVGRYVAPKEPCK